MRRNAKLAFVVVAGAAVGAILSRRRRPAAAPPGPSDHRAEELRQKLAEARAAVADEDDFEAAGMGAETFVEEPSPEPKPKPEATAPAKQRMKPAAERPPSDEFEAMRRRIHEEGRSAAEEMRRSGEKPDQA